MIPRTFNDFDWKPCADCQQILIPVHRNHVRCVACAAQYRVAYHRAYDARRHKRRMLAKQRRAA